MSGGGKLELGNIESLELYVDREVEEKEGLVVKRVPLDGDLEIGETAYFRGSGRNKVVKQDDEEYIFYRFDEIQTHIEDYDSGYSIGDIIENINSNFDYDLEYASERVDLIDKLIEENEWVYELLSSNRVIQKEQKKKSSFLAENQSLDGNLQRIADYVLHPKFNDKKMKHYFEDLRESHKNLQQKKGKTEKDFQNLISIREEIDLINQRIMTNSSIQRNKLRERYGEDVSDLEGTNVIIDSADFTTEKSKVEYTGRDLEIDEGYWERMGFNGESAEFRKGIIYEYDRALLNLSRQLGHGQDTEIKKQTEKKTMERLGVLEYIDDNGKMKTISPKRRFEGLKRMYSELKSDYYRAKEILTVPISFTQMTPTTTKYDFNTDTWYIDEEGKEIEVSKNILSFGDVNTYKGLTQNYYDLNDKYNDKFTDDMWAILLAFEDLVNNTDLSKEERFVLSEIMSDKTRKEISESYLDEFGNTISLYSLSRWANNIIPGKILNTYLKSVDEWLYTYKIKGKFKRCSRCEEVKLISNNRYFSPDSRNTDGFRSVCRSCRK